MIQHNTGGSSGDLTIVTGFFDIGRGKRKNQNRSNGEYIESFKKWARIRNNMIIYVTKDFADKVMEIRKGYGLERATHVNIVDNIYEIEPDIYSRLIEIEKKGIFKQWRYYDYLIYNDARYNYVIFMRYWMICDAVERGLVNGLIAWVDFGWNHDNYLFPNEEEFDFKWHYPFENDKVHIFAMHDPKNEIGFLKLMKMTNEMMGSPVICPSQCSGILFQYIKDAMWALLSLDAMDNDQMLLTMAYKIHPEFFSLHLSKGWFWPMKEYGGKHLTVKAETKEPKGRQLIQKVKVYGVWNSIFRGYLKIIKHMNYPSYAYSKRLIKVLNSYYPDW